MNEPVDWFRNGSQFIVNSAQCIVHVSRLGAMAPDTQKLVQDQDLEASFI